MSRDLLAAAADRVDYRLAFGRTNEPRRCRPWGIDGPDLPNAYHDRGLRGDRSATGPGGWEDPDHPVHSDRESVHIDRWFMSAIREAVHEALEWYWVDGSIYLDPHGPSESEIHEASENFALALLNLRGEATS